jgi:redox-sensitive bicupin YhaK (pirin superfamily)
MVEPESPTVRPVASIVTAAASFEGAGFPVHRPFPQPGAELTATDPFLMLDEMGPVEYGPGEAKGAPDHPHRGFETVTYLLDGRMEHGDSRGNRGRLTPGDVQWMTAGSGVVHSEMPEAEFASRGGRMHGFQLWVNLPRRDKMMAPRYQEVPAARIPVGRSEDGKVVARVIAGEALGEKAVIDTRIPIVYLDLTLSPGGVHEQPLPAGFNAFVYVVEGSGRFDASGKEAGAHDLVLFSGGGDAVRIEAPEGGGALRVLLVAGQPLGEPVARAGPFVMNTRAEIVQAFEDFQAGRLG